MLTSRLNRLALFLMILLLALTTSSSSNTRTIKAQSFNVLAQSTIIEYRSFGGITYQLQAFNGRFIRYALPSMWTGPNGLSSEEIMRLVDQTDLVYAHMKEMVAGEPAGQGLLTIAIVDLGGHDGLGLNGSKGVEISPAQLGNVREHIQAGRIPETLIHEIGHNFNLYHQYLGYYPDWNHAWTTFFITYTQYYMQEGSLILPDAEDQLETKIGEYGYDWDSLGQNASWERCVRDRNCQGVSANEAWAAFMLRYARLHGQKAVIRAFVYLRDYKTAHPVAPSTAEQKNDLLIRSLSEGAQANISCEVDHLHWSATAALRNELLSVFGGNNPACADSDGDSSSRLTGDTNDQNPMISPQAVEILNGIDDDCDLIKDDLTIREQEDFPSLDGLFGRPVRIPVRIRGYAEAGGEDSVLIRVTRAGPIKLKLRNRGEFHGWINLRSINSIGGGAEQSFYTLTMPVAMLMINRPGTWSIQLVPDAGLNPGDPGGAGNYDLTIEEASSPASQPTLSLDTRRSIHGTLRVTAHINQSVLEDGRTTRIRFWISGLGFVSTQPVSGIVQFNLPMPPDQIIFMVRAELLEDTHPSMRPTSGVWFTIPIMRENRPEIIEPDPD